MEGPFKKTEQRKLEPAKFERGQLVTSPIESPEEFVEIIGTAFYKKCESRYGSDAAALIKQASAALLGSKFKVLAYVPGYPGEVHKMRIKFEFNEKYNKAKLLEDEEIARLNDEFIQSYKTGILFFLYTEIIWVDAADFELADSI